MAINNFNNCTNCNKEICECDNKPTLLYSSDIQDIYENTHTGLRIVVNKFEVEKTNEEHLYMPEIQHVQGSYNISEFTKDYYSARKNQMYKAGTKLYKQYHIIPTDNTSKWGFNIISRETTLSYDEFITTSIELEAFVEYLKVRSWAKDHSMQSLADFVKTHEEAEVVNA